MMTIAELIEQLRQYPPTLEVVVDDGANGQLLAPVLVPLRNRDGDGVDALEIAWPSQVGDLGPGDVFHLDMLEWEMQQRGEAFDEGDGGSL